MHHLNLCEQSKNYTNWCHFYMDYIQIQYFSLKVILYSYLILKKMNEHITDS